MVFQSCEISLPWGWNYFPLPPKRAGWIFASTSMRTHRRRGSRPYEINELNILLHAVAMLIYPSYILSIYHSLCNQKYLVIWRIHWCNSEHGACNGGLFAGRLKANDLPGNLISRYELDSPKAHWNEAFTEEIQVWPCLCSSKLPNISEDTKKLMKSWFDTLEKIESWWRYNLPFRA